MRSFSPDVENLQALKYGMPYILDYLDGINKTISSFLLDSLGCVPDILHRATPMKCSSF